MVTLLVSAPYPTPRKTTSKRELFGQLAALTAWIKNSPSEAYRAIIQMKSITPSATTPPAAPPASPTQKTKFKLPHPAMFKGEREL